MLLFECSVFHRCFNTFFQYFCPVERTYGLIDMVVVLVFKKTETWAGQASGKAQESGEGGGRACGRACGD